MAPSHDTQGEIRIYRPDSNTGWGVAVWRSMLADVWAGRSLMWVLFWRSFVATYRQTLFGWLGTVLDPMLLVAPFMVLAFTGIFQPGEINAPYPAFALLGLTLFHLANDCIRECSGAILGNSSLVIKINFAKEVLVFARAGQVIVNFAIRIVFVALILAGYRYCPPSYKALLFPLAVLPMFFMSMGFGLALACLSVLMRDVGKYVNMLLPFFLLISPILYARPRIHFFARFNQFNPFSVLVNGPRDLLLYGHLYEPVPFICMSIASVAIFIVSWRLFRVASVHLAAQLGAK